MNKARAGFTIVELLIVIVVIAILAAISIISYSNIAAKARDSQRMRDIETISKALEMYYADNGKYPDGSCGASCPTPKKWSTLVSTTADGSWSVLEAALVPKYISTLPRDPMASIATQAAAFGGYNYDYVRWVRDACDVKRPNTFMLVYKLESQDQRREVAGSCQDGVNPADYVDSSEKIVLKR